MKRLSVAQIKVLEAAIQCDSVNNYSQNLRVLNNLAAKGYLEAFNSNRDYFTNREIVDFSITDAGRDALAGHHAGQTVTTRKTVSIKDAYKKRLWFQSYLYWFMREDDTVGHCVASIVPADDERFLVDFRTSRLLCNGDKELVIFDTLAGQDKGEIP